MTTVIDSQSVKAADTVGKESRGYDAGKKINGRKRRLVVDTKGLPLFFMVTPAAETATWSRKCRSGCSWCTSRSPSSGPTPPMPHSS